MEKLLKSIKYLPHKPGVYLMKDKDGKVIYIGKAKSLKARVRSYFRGGDSKGDGRAQIRYLLRKVESIESILVETENQAFVLERDLINKYHPRYNIRLKDDKAYLCVRIDTGHAWPKLELVRRIQQDGAKYFGPYSFSYELRSLLDIIKRVVPLRTCSDTVFYNRQRPCLEYQIKRCAGPCCLSVERIQYMQWVKQAIAILEGKTDSLKKELNQHMELASKDLNFEEAAIIRDRIKVLESTQSTQALYSSGAEDRDIFALYREESLVVVSVLRIRQGRIAESLNFPLSEVYLHDAEVLESVLGQFYGGDREIPPEIVFSKELTNQEMLASVLAERKGASVEFVFPKKGLKLRLIRLAELNARQHFISSFEEGSRNAEHAKELARVLKLSQVPRRIECVDISNLQGTSIVGAVVVFYDGLPDKGAYRKYKVSFEGKPDDFAAIYEVVTRRLRRGLEEQDLPDLLIIDGGSLQLKKALQAREEVGVKLDIVALAKEKEGKPERIYTPDSSEVFVLEPEAALTKFVTRIRDEAHRYVISFHRKKRGEKFFASLLDAVPALGPERARRLLREYGSITGMKGVTAKEISRKAKVPLMVAQRVVEVVG